MVRLARVEILPQVPGADVEGVIAFNGAPELPAADELYSILIQKSPGNHPHFKGVLA